MTDTLRKNISDTLDAAERLNPELNSFLSIEREKASQTASLRESLEDPLSTAFRLARAHLFDGTGYGLHSLGTEASLAGLDRFALSSHHSRHFQGSNTVAS